MPKQSKPSLATATPIGDHVLIRLETHEYTEGGLQLPQVAADKEKNRVGTVVAVGRGLPTNDGVFIAPVCRPGDRVVFNYHAAEKVKSRELEEEDGVQFVFIQERNVYGVLA